MTVSTTNSFSQHVAAGATVFAFNFQILDEDDLIVKTTDPDTGTETLKVLTTDYTVSAGPWAAGGTVTFGVAPTTGHVVTLIRNMVITQETDLVSGSALPAESLERAIDRNVLLIQRISDLVVRALKLADGSTLTEITLPEPDPGKVLGWNALGTEIENKTLGFTYTTTTSTFAIGTYTFASVSAGASSTPVDIAHGLGTDDIDFGATVTGGGTATLPKMINTIARLVGANRHFIDAGNVSSLSSNTYPTITGVPAAGYLRVNVHNTDPTPQNITVNWWARTRS